MPIGRHERIAATRYSIRSTVSLRLANNLSYREVTTYNTHGSSADMHTEEGPAHTQTTHCGGGTFAVKNQAGALA